MSNYKQGALASLIISIIIFVIVFILIIAVSYNWRANYYNNSNQLTSPQLLAAAAMYNKNHFVTQGGIRPPPVMGASTVASMQSQTLTSADIPQQSLTELFNKDTFFTNSPNSAGSNISTISEGQETISTAQGPYGNSI